MGVSRVTAPPSALRLVALLLLLAAPPVAGEEEPASLWAEIEALADGGDAPAALARLDAVVGRQTLPALRLRHRLLHQLGRYAEADSAAERWTAAARAAGDGKEALGASRSLARSLLARGEHDRAIELLRSSADNAAAQNEHELEAELRLYLSRAQSEQAAYGNAAAALERAEALLQRIDAPDLEVRLWIARGLLSFYRGNPYDSLEAYEEAIRLGTEIDSGLLPVAYTSLAQVQRSVHDYAAAVVALHQSQELREEPDIVTLTELGICHFDLNQLSQAEAAFEAARTLAVELGNGPLVSWTTGELGLVAWARRDSARAEELFDRAIALTRETGDRRNELIWWMNKGRMRRDQERYREALDLYARAEALQNEIAGLPPYPNLYKHMAQCEIGLGRPDRALSLLERAVRIAAQDNNRQVLWEAHRELALLHRDADRREEAESAFAAALAAVESMRDSLRLESFKADFFTDKVHLYEELVTFLASDAAPAASERAFAVAERARARAFLDSLVESRARAETTLPEAVRRQEESILDRISALQAAQRRAAAPAGAAVELGKLEAELQALYLQVRRDHPRFTALRSVEVASLGAIQQALRPGELLLEYFVAEPASHLWLVEKDRLEHRTLDGKRELEAAVADLYARLIAPGSELDDIETLAGRLLPPELGGAPRRVESLLIVPSGALFLLPFEVLPLANGSPLGERFATSYLPSATILVELRERPTAVPPPRLLALADPFRKTTPDTARGAGIERLGSLGALPHAQREVAGVRSRFGRGASTLLLGEEASESRLKSLPLREFSVLHFATHGWLDARSPARSGIVLADETASAEDGILQPREILRLELAADLVTLSACQTALGNLITGEGIVGLSRAFFYAGTDSVIASLWNVNDEATAEFMDLFYRSLAAGKGKGEALRRARSAMRQRRAHPFYWAPWILLGRGEDAVELPPRAVTPGQLLVLLSLSLLLAAWWLVRRRRSGG